MYWFAETRAAHMAFWAIVRDRLRESGIRAPQSLTDTGTPHEIWSADDLVLSHICNLPYRLQYRDRLTRIGASDYGLEGCPPGHFRALFVVHRDHVADSPDELDGATMALNSDDSHSGWGAAATWAIERGMRFRPTLRTGSHEQSIGAVVSRYVDFATIDARSFQILRRLHPVTDLIRVIGATDPAPGMTFVTRTGEDPAPYLAALRAGIAEIDGRHRDWLGLKDVIVLPDEAYDLPLPPDPRDWQA
jgi:ABC-type phosphate/phosphonate transport system substrate-binding protein